MRATADPAWCRADGRCLYQGDGAMLSQNAQWCCAETSAAVTGSVSPAGCNESSVGLFCGSKRGHGGAPLGVGFPVAANVVTYATSWFWSTCWLASRAGVTGFRNHAPTCDAPGAIPPTVYGGKSLSSISYAYTFIRLARSVSVCNEGHTVSESAATVRQ